MDYYYGTENSEKGILYVKYSNGVKVLFKTAMVELENFQDLERCGVPYGVLKYIYSTFIRWDGFECLKPKFTDKYQVEWIPFRSAR